MNRPLTSKITAKTPVRFPKLYLNELTNLQTDGLSLIALVIDIAPDNIFKEISKVINFDRGRYE